MKLFESFWIHGYSNPISLLVFLQGLMKRGCFEAGVPGSDNDGQSIMLRLPRRPDSTPVPFFFFGGGNGHSVLMLYDWF